MITNSSPVPVPYRATKKDYDDKSGLVYYWLQDNMGHVLIITLFACLGLWGLLLEERIDLGMGQKLVKGMGPELAGIVIAAVTVNALAEKRQETQRKKILVSQLGSKYRDVTELALIELRHREWLYDGSLNGVMLGRANLEKAHLGGAELKGVALIDANMSEAFLWKVNLSYADLEGANLSRASLRGANLSCAKLFNANLSEANLEGANLGAAALAGTDLSGVYFWTVEQLEQAWVQGATIMPDGIKLGSSNSIGPSFKEWKAQYLAKYGGTNTDARG